jgi:hypothetical protein
MMKTTLITLIVFLASAAPLRAQYLARKEIAGASLLYSISSHMLIDTVNAQVSDDSLSAPYLQTKSTLLAMGLSAVFPGAGQIYNESYWKTPIIIGLGGWFVYEWIQNNKLYRDYRDQYNASITPTATSGDSRLLTIREFYRDQRDSFAWYLGLLYAVNILDAYVDASLYDFGKDSKVSLRTFPQPTGIAINLKLSF